MAGEGVPVLDTESMELGELAAERAQLARTSTAERVAEILRAKIAEGYFLSGTRLSEDKIVGALGVSRNTLREAFRLLTHERLLVHELNRGVFVRTLAVPDVVDLYRVRKMIECAAVQDLREPVPAMAAVGQAVKDGHAAASDGRWQDLGTANIRFHQAITALAGSPRLDEMMAGLVAELRLVFHVMADPRRFHEPYLLRNQQIYETLATGDGPATATLLADYFDDAERQLVAAYAEQVGH